MQDQPTARELLDAAAEFLETELTPTVTDPRLRFRTLVATNILRVVSRELSLGDTQLLGERERLQALLGKTVRNGELRSQVLELNRTLAARIRSGEADEGAFRDAVMAEVEQTVVEKLLIANPKYLDRLLNE